MNHFEFLEHVRHTLSFHLRNLDNIWTVQVWNPGLLTLYVAPSDMLGYLVVQHELIILIQCNNTGNLLYLYSLRNFIK